MLACGISPLRLFRPVLAAGLFAGLVTLYVMVWLLPACNQHVTDMVWGLLGEQTEQEIKAGLFYEGFAGKVVYVQASSPVDGWSGVFIADISQPGRPAVVLAQHGNLYLNKARQQVILSLIDATQYVPGADANVYDISRTASPDPLILTVPAADVFAGAEHGFPEMSIAELRASIAADIRAGGTGRTQYFYLEQMFSFPVACVVFALLALPVGLHTRKEGRLAGMVIGLAIVCVYYALLKGAESVAKGNLLPPIWARWVPNLVLGPIGLVGLSWRARATGFGSGIRWTGLWTRLVGQRTARPGGSAAGPAAGSGAGARRGLVRLLDAYVSVRYLRVLALAFFGLLGLYYIGAVLDVSERIFKQQATPEAIGWYLWYSTPQFVTFAVPIATLIAVLATIGGLTRSNELTVMRACGISLYRAAAPLIGLSLVSSAVLFGVQEHVLAHANQQAQRLRDEIKTGAPVQVGALDNAHWLAASGGRILNYGSFNATGTPALSGLSVFETADHPYRLRTHVYAASAVFRDGAWYGHDGWMQDFDPAAGATRVAFADRRLDLPAPDVFTALRVDTNGMTFPELRAHIRQLAASGFSVSDERVRLQNKIAFPLITLVMTLLGVPFGLTTGRRGAMYGIGLAIVLAFAYWLLAFFFVAVGSAGLLPPALAAWATNILFAAAAGFLVLTVRT